MTIRLHLPLARHLSTKYIEINTNNCQACWKCVEACPEHVLGKAILFRHRHAHVDHAQACKGCKKCVHSCPNNAIRYTYVPASRKPRNDHNGAVIEQFSDREYDQARV